MRRHLCRHIVQQHCCNYSNNFNKNIIVKLLAHFYFILLLLSFLFSQQKKKEKKRHVDVSLCAESSSFVSQAFLYNLQNNLTLEE